MENYFDNGILNYFWLNKAEWSNSYLENYNRHSAVSRG